MRLLNLSLTVLLLAATAAADVEEKETIRRSFPFHATPRPTEVLVDAVTGAIRVTGYNGDEVQVVVQKTLRADTPERAQEGNREVKLDITEQSDRIRLYVDGPFRCCCNDCRGSNDRGRRYNGYEVRYDFELKVPAGTGLKLKTVNGGTIEIENTSGSFDVENINGGVEMKDVSGSGRVYALNGRVEVTFRKNPEAASFFGSLNGQVNVTFQPSLSADLRFKTFNGNVYTDFPSTALPQTAPVSEQRNGKFVYKTDQTFGVRVGAGGPELKFDAFNGNIRVLSASRP